MKKLFSLLIALAALALVASPALAETTTNQVITPADVNNVVGVQGDFAPGFPSGSIASNGISKTDIYFIPDSLFGRDVTLGEISEISYWTKKDTTHVADAADWFLAIYTKPYSGDVSTATWYGDRIGTEPYFSINLDAPADTWNNWTTDGSSNQLRFFESTQGASGATFGSYTDSDWADFVAGNALSGYSYSSHNILYFSVQTGSGWVDGFTGQVDGLTITLTDGSVANVNFEPNIVRHAEITSPTIGQYVNGMVDFAAYLVDDDADAIQWAVRKGTCAANTSTVFGNVDGHSDVAVINQSNLENQTFSFTGDMSTMDSGMYCFIYNPTEDSGESDIRKTVEFNLIAPPDTQAPTVPTNLHWVNKADESVLCGSVITDLVAGAVKADWDDSTDNVGVDHYEYVSFNPVNGWAWPSLDLGYLVTNSEYGDANYTPSVGEYGFMVRAVDAAGNKSEWTDVSKTIAESCKITFSNGPILINPPTNMNECKKDEWKTFNNPTFKNQGTCVSYVQSNEKAGKRNN